MVSRFLSAATGAGVLALILVTAGCSSGETTGTDAAPSGTTSQGDGHGHGHDHGSASMTFPDAVAKLKEYQESIQSAFAAGNPEECHGALHAVGHVLQDLPALAAAAGLGETEQETVKEAAGQLMSAFGEVDKTMHGAPDGAQYADVEASVNEAMGAIESLAATL
jgi:hypothetical protein